MNPLTQNFIYIYIYIYIIFQQKIILNPLQYKFAPPHHQPDLVTPLFFKAQLILQKKKKEVQKKILVFNLRNKKPINQNLKNHKLKKKGSNKT